MKTKTKLLLFFFTNILLYPLSGNNLNDSELTIYVCTGKQAGVYHYHIECYELEQCNTSILQLKLKNVERTRTRCDKCYPELKANPTVSPVPRPVPIIIKERQKEKEDTTKIAKKSINY